MESQQPVQESLFLRNLLFKVLIFLSGCLKVKVVKNSHIHKTSGWLQKSGPESDTGFITSKRTRFKPKRIGNFKFLRDKQGLQSNGIF